MKKLIQLLFLLACYTYSVGQTVNYTASDAIIANPERGLQKYSRTSSDYSTTPGANNFTVATLKEWKNSKDKITVVYRIFMIDAFKNSDINSTFLENIQTDFDNARSAGVKLIVRFAYSRSIDTTAQQPVKAQILSHITQLSPLLTANKDVIFSFQAGFVGTWGEWYYTNSEEFGTEGAISKNQWANRKEILDSMLAAVPAEIPLQVRYPGIKKTLYGTTQLNPETAYKNTANSRIGFFNDAFLNNYGDMGTFSVSSKCKNPVGTTDYNYLSNETKYLPMTGETNGINSCDNGFRTTGENAAFELGMSNWTSLNRDYHNEVWNQIIASGKYDEILKNLGYRFVLDSSTLTRNNEKFELTLNISNVGYARPFKARNVYLVLKNKQTGQVSTRLIDTDIRTWEGMVTVSHSFIPEQSGTFQLYLWMPDNDTSIADNPDYSIQLANSNLWEAETGYNNLLQTVEFNMVGTETFPADKDFSITVSPASDFITVQFKNADKQKVQIYNEVGQLVIEKTILNNQSIDISELLKGVYIVRLSSNKSSTRKFLKQ